MITITEEEYVNALEMHGKLMYNLALDMAYLVLNQIVDDDGARMKAVLNSMKKTL